MVPGLSLLPSMLRMNTHSCKWYSLSSFTLQVLLLTGIVLAHLELRDITQTGYISPDAMVACLATSTKLEILWI